MSPKKSLRIKIQLDKKKSKTRIVLKGKQSATSAHGTTNATDSTINKTNSGPCLESPHDLLLDRSSGQSRIPNHVLKQFMDRPLNRMGMTLGAVSSASIQHTQFKEIVTQGKHLNQTRNEKMATIHFGQKMKVRM